ncbi:Alpha,alpha-trehalose-phosphate synthase [UDP-forming] 1 [Quercus suber]|uniref:alpha,alpha-trehalose-phosphate synthase (UDP-forming) n=1 Tax=Quercus suber TaxID=58331 RepID=A0AAW0LGW2_QUESU
MPGNKYVSSPNHVGSSNHIPGRVERLLRDRELRKNNRTCHSSELNDNISRLSESFEHELRLREVENGHARQYLEGPENERSHLEGRERLDGRPCRQRLLVVANRLPVSAVRRGEDSWSLEISAGGLVSALLGVKEFEARWIGWAGVNVPDEVGQKALTKALAEKRCIPVFLDEEIVHQYYNGYCNNILWPLFHYLGLPQEDRLATTRSFQSQFAAYKKANQMFADVVNDNYEEGDVVWCHDYHLMFLPKCLKEYNIKMKVGWFLHTPFPSSEIHRTLPSRSELLRSVLAADLVGFHTYDYARHFVSACTRILGLEGTPEGVEDQGRLTRVAAFPIGIDSDRFIRALDASPVQDNIRELAERFKGRKVMLGVDRLDMIKGIPQKILAFEKFLEENPDWRDKVVLLQIAVPTRTDVPEYQKLTSQDRSLDFHALCALYAITDVALVTSLRDGMNLVSYEFVACQDTKKGVLILSEFAGAAQSLGAGAILVNPWNITEVAASIAQALNMPADEREKRHKHNFAHVTSHTAQEWAETFVSELNDTVVEAKLRTRQVPPSLPNKDAINRYLHSNNRLLILNFGEYDMWLAAEHGMFLRLTKGEWMTTMPEHLNMEWVESVMHVLEYFTERTPRSHFERRATSLVWNYKYADVEFGRLQARDMLQHLWTGPISNASVDVVQGGRSVEVRAVGVTKGAAIDRILGEIVHSKSMTTPIDYVLCIGHFLTKDEDVYTFFEPELPSDASAIARAKANDGLKLPSERRSSLKLPANRSGSKSSSSQSKTQRPLLNSDKRITSHTCGSGRRPSPEKVSWNVLDLKGENYFSCAVGRTRTNARYTLGSSDDVVSFLKELADAS